MLVKEEGFPAVDREGCRAEFVKNTNEKACCLSVCPSECHKLTSALKMVPEQTLKVLLTGSSVYCSWSPVGGSVSYERVIILKYFCTFIVES